jgi:hypothetical protein
MRISIRTSSSHLAIAAALLLAPAVHAQQAPTAGPGDLAGVVTSTKGPEAGVWVIAETTDLPTKLTKIVVTDDQGRYRIPDLPKANYSVWVRGYGLVDSAHVASAPGKTLNLKASIAPDAAAAAAYYPAIYWYSMIKIPGKGEFPGTGQSGNGIEPSIKTQEQWIDWVKTDGCYTCHQLGDKATRTIPKELGTFESGADAWERRIQSGQAATNMVNSTTRVGLKRAFAMFGDWTDRVARGELPASAPQRPQGVERNIVITEWDWANPKVYLHDEASTDKRNPTVNAYGKIYGAPEESTDYFPILDPAHATKAQAKMPVRDPETPSSAESPVLGASVYWGEEPIWNSQTTMHNPMFDEKGRVWFTARIRPADNPDFCKKASDLASAKLFPLERSGRQLAMYDPKAEKFTLINTCFGTHHLQFGFDDHQTLWTSSGGGGEALGWFDRKVFEETGDEKKAQGWTAFVLDTNGNGKRDDYVEPNQPLDPKKDKRIAVAFYGVAPSPADGSIWGSVLGVPGALVRVNLGADPPATALAEIYELPMNDPKAPVSGFAPRGMDIDSNGVVWAPLASGQFASFDRRKCKGPLNGPNATGKQCPEGWTLYPFPGPQFAGLAMPGSAEASYYSWVDQHNTFGLGANVPIATGNANDALLALVNGKWVTLRVPYPLGFFAKGLDGRIDDPKGDWKGKGLWTTWGTRTPFHAEGGKDNSPKVLHFQLRPDPLAG